MIFIAASLAKHFAIADHFVIRGSFASQKKRARGATGLSLLSRLAEIHGGRCWVEERPGGGASFRVFLPDAMSSREQEPMEDVREEVAVRPKRELDERAMALARALAEADEEEELTI